MALFNYATKEITLKIVYYGPGLSGKTTNLQFLHSVLNPNTTGKLLSLATESDRTLFFDFLPIELGKIRDFSVRFQLYTVPGQVRYNATRKVVLKGADAVVFIADSQREMKDQNVESLLNKRENLNSNNINPDEIPIILQYNKRDLRNISSVEEMNRDLNAQNYHVMEAVAVKGTGVEDTFKLITRLILRYISDKHKIEIQPASDREAISRPEATPQMSERATGQIPLSAMERTEMITEHKQGGFPGTIGPQPQTSGIHGDASPADAKSRSPVRGITEFPPVTHEKTDKIMAEFEKIQKILSDMNTSLSDIRKGVRELPAIRKDQEDMNRTLRDIISTLEGLKPKRSWFRF